MHLDDFDYGLPADRIAQVPVEPRDSARLLVDRGSLAPMHQRVADLPDLLEPGDLVVVNDSKVIPARLRLWRTSGGAAEVLLLEPEDGARRRWAAKMKRCTTMWHHPTWVSAPWWDSSMDSTTVLARSQRSPSHGHTSVAPWPSCPITWMATGERPFA